MAEGRVDRVRPLPPGYGAVVVGPALLSGVQHSNGKIPQPGCDGPLSASGRLAAPGVTSRTLDLGQRREPAGARLPDWSLVEAGAYPPLTLRASADGDRHGQSTAGHVRSRGRGPHGRTYGRRVVGAMDSTDTGFRAAAKPTCTAVSWPIEQPATVSLALTHRAGGGEGRSSSSV